MFKRKHHLVGLFVLFLITGCATTIKGPVFHPVGNVPENKSLVYIYWTDKAARIKGIDFSIKANGESLTDMRHGGYYQYFSDPGTLELSSHVNFKFMAVGLLDVAMAPTEKLEIDIDGGGTYYVRCISHGANAFNYALTMMLVDKERGEYEIREAKLLPKNSSGTNAKIPE